MSDAEATEQMDAPTVELWAGQPCTPRPLGCVGVSCKNGHECLTPEACGVGVSVGTVWHRNAPRMGDSTVAVYKFMVEFFGRNDQLPPIEKIRCHMGWASPNAVVFHVEELERLGLIERNETNKYRFARRA